MPFPRILSLISTLAILQAPVTAAGDAPLALHIDPGRLSVSGLSSGAWMAGQLHVAHSSRIGGAALLAGGPYGCAGGSLTKALGLCTRGGKLDTGSLVKKLRRLGESGVVDDPANLADDRVWVFHGSADVIVDASVTTAAADFYRAFVSPESVALVDDVPAAHGMPTQASGLACGEMAPPFVNACGFDAAGALLEHLYGPLEPPAAVTGPLRELDQRAHAAAGLWEHAFVYVPESCLDGAACGLHVAFHGCRQSAEFVGDTFASSAGYNEWAESNRLVVLYPQVASSTADPVNPHGCWDWWGYTGERYATKRGPQVAAVMALIDTLIGSARP